MRLFLRLSILCMLFAMPVFVGCSSNLSEEETPIVASDEDDGGAETPVSDPENP